MKKKIKIAAISLAVLVLVFLSLPFFAPKATSNPKAGENAQQNTPQIFTSNPLTELVNRIAAVFGKKNAGIHSAGGMQNANSNAVAEEMLADARAAAANTPTTEETPKAGEEGPFGSFFGDGEEEWVLAPQFSPEGTTRGMHEISAKGDAYDNYIRAERAARFTPVAINPRTKEVPNSKLARIFNPIKRFFGFDDPYATDSDWYDEEAAHLAYVQGDSESAKDPRQFKRAGIADMGMPNLSVNGQGASNAENTSEAKNANDALGEVFSFFYPEAKIQELAKRKADALYPAPRTPKQQASWEVARLEEAKRLYDEMQEKKFSYSNIKVDKATPPDFTKVFKCSKNKPTLSLGNACPLGEEPLSEQEKQEMKTENERKFLNLLGDPGDYEIPVTVVYGKGIDSQKMWETLEDTGNFIEDAKEEGHSDLVEEYSKNAELQQLYKFMAEQAKCETENCYWVATSNQPHPSLEDSVDLAGKTVFKGDPLNRFQKLHEQFIQNFQKDPGTLLNNPTDQEIKETAESIRELTPAYVVYTQEDMKKWAEQIKKDMFEGNFQSLSLLYTATADTGRALAEVGHSPVIGTDAKALVEQTAEEEIVSLEQRTTTISQDVLEGLEFYQNAWKEVHQHTEGEICALEVKNKVGRLQEEGAHPEELNQAYQDAQERASKTRP